MSIKMAVRRVFDETEATGGDAGKDAVKAVRGYARVTCASPSSVADFARAVAAELGEMARKLDAA